MEVKLKEGPFKISELRPGDIQKWGKRYYFACPRCGMALALDHEVQVDNGVVTISPSVGHQACGLHIYVKKGKIDVLGDLT